MRNPTPRFPLRPLLAVILASLSQAALAANEFTPVAPPGSSESMAYAISGDGAVMTGDIKTGTNFEAFRWGAGNLTLGSTIPGAGAQSHGYALSFDGSVIVGGNYAPDPGWAGGSTPVWQPAVWKDGTMSNLGFLSYTGGSYAPGAFAQGVSADGSVVVGQSYRGSHWEAFRWTQTTGMVGLGFVNFWGYGSSGAQAVSADGSTIVGGDYKSDGHWQAFRWTEESRMQGLGFLPGTINSYAYGVSADGTVVVGQSGTQAFRWVSTGMTGLGYLGSGSSSLARAVSADGNVVVGYSEAAGTKNAFRWSASSGMLSVADWLSTAGVTLPGGWQLNDATGISGNGNVVVGTGTTGEGTTRAWLARVGPASGIIQDLTAFNAGLAEVGGHAMQSSVALMDFALFGAHHRTLLDTPNVRSGRHGCMWATAEGARSNTHSSSVDLIEIGLCKDIGPTRIGLGIGNADSTQNMTLDGRARQDGQYLVGEIAHDLGQGRILSLTGYYGRFDARFERRYENGTSIDTSTGNTSSDAHAIRMRMEWNDLFSLGRMSLGPYASYSRYSSTLDGFTETGGAFPASYTDITTRINDWRLGLGGTMAIGSRTDLKVMAAAVSRTNNSDHAIQGRLVDLWAFSFADDGGHERWGDVSLDIDHRLDDRTRLSLGARTLNAGAHWAWGLSAGVHASF